jgi:predicted hydrocarbon binding protein
MSTLHERLVFDIARGEVRDEDRRYVLVRADVLMGLFDDLPDHAREDALRAFGRSVSTHGRDSLQAYARANGIDGLPPVVERAAASLGWGIWSIERDDSALRLEVRNSPFAAGSRRSDAPVCHAIAGMLDGVAFMIFGSPSTVRETSCSAVAGTGVCRFIATPGDRARHS